MASAGSRVLSQATFCLGCATLIVLLSTQTINPDPVQPSQRSAGSSRTPILPCRS
jgi:hypothetical protein